MMPFALVLWVLVLTFAVCGWGAAFAWVAGAEREFRSWQLPKLFVIGLFAVTLGALALNFVFSLTENAGLIVIAAGILLMLLLRRYVHIDLKVFVLVLVGTIWVVCGLPYDGLFNDAGLYHLQVEQWIARSPLLWGLANLHTRFGFDSMWLMFVSASRINASEWLPVWTHAVVADMAIRAFVFWWLLMLWITSVRDGDRFGSIFFAFAFLLLSLMLWRMRAAGTDVPANLIAIGLWLLVYEALILERQSSIQAAAAICSAALIVTFKLSILPMALLVLAVLYAHRNLWKKWIPLLFLAAIYVCLWLLRNFVLTGCLVYPVAPTCFDVPWGLGIEQARHEALVTMMFARQHLGPNLQADLADRFLISFNIDWFLVWLRKFPKTYYFHLMLGYFFIGICAFVFLRNRGQVQIKRVHFLVCSIMVAILGFFYWLVFGPDPRFSWAVFFVISMGFIGFGFQNMPIKNNSRLASSRASKGVLCGLILLALFNLAIKGVPINFERYSSYGYQDQIYEWTPLEHRGALFHVAKIECGDRIPCIMHDVSQKALDRFIEANKNLRDLPAFNPENK